MNRAQLTSVCGWLSPSAGRERQSRLNARAANAYSIYIYIYIFSRNVTRSRFFLSSTLCERCDINTIRRFENGISIDISSIIGYKAKATMEKVVIKPSGCFCSLHNFFLRAPMSLRRLIDTSSASIAKNDDLARLAISAGWIIYTWTHGKQWSGRNRRTASKEKKYLSLLNEGEKRRKEDKRCARQSRPLSRALYLPYAIDSLGTGARTITYFK